ncbi:restriction endonuclease subunit S [Aeromonas hydrophila]|uniref:restriction endonuclease subunit S n=1 Tax=Aeromonas hydrophila TaxID=644 RepID=UPI00188E1F6E|nr:restriction endonuclease subunit S [Aeromonas hydrophila]MBF4798374.1 restriction endonuclease subunit S [Aeromonas hydrophila]
MSFDLPVLPDGWTYVPLEQLAQKNSVTYGVVQPGTHVEEGVPIVRVNNFKDGCIELADVMRIAPDIESKYGRTRLEGGEVLLTIVGSVGQVAVVPRGLKGFNVARAVAVIHLTSAVESDWLALCLRSPLSQHLLTSRANTTVQTTINLKDLRALPVPIPPKAERRRIADLLSALNDRIYLLRETNATLEAIAQALFKSWFVDFDPVHARARGEQPAGLAPEVAALFPDSFEESVLGRVPKGWRTGAFRDVCVRIESGGTPRRSVPEYWGGGVSWLSSGEVRSPIVFDTKETITDLGVKESAAKLWPQGTTVVAMYGATAGEVCLLARPTTANQACCGLIAKPQARAFMFMCARRERAALASKSSGSAQQNLNKGIIENHPLVLPPIELLSTYEESAGALLDCWIANDHQAQILATLRDTLLPRLISGQLRLPDAEQQLKDLAV